MSDSRPPPNHGLVRITRLNAAVWQLETAIYLWFNEMDVASIHTLTVAAQGILTTLAREKGISFGTQDWMKSQPPNFREKVRDAQNFFKHGYHRGQGFRYKDVLSYQPQLAEIFIVDAIAVYSRVFGSITRVMLLFSLRFALDNPKTLLIDGLKTMLPDGVDIEAFASLSKSQFLEQLLPRL